MQCLRCGRAFLDVAIPVEGDRLQRRQEFLRKRCAGHCIQKKTPQLRVTVGCFQDGADFAVKFRAHEAGHRMLTPVFGPEIRIAFGEALQGVEESPRLFERESFGIPIAQNGVGIRFDAPPGKDAIEVREPRVQSAQRSGHPLALTE